MNDENCLICDGKLSIQKALENCKTEGKEMIEDLKHLKQEHPELFKVLMELVEKK